ncbi:MAG: glycosyltransferase family 2 protein [Conexivisphaerales archaeon]
MNALIIGLGVFLTIPYVAWFLILIRYLDSNYTSPTLKQYAPADDEVSVIIATRNDDVSSCVNSLLRSRGVKEIIIVDDHSDDRTQKHLKEISSIDNRIKLLYLNSEDSGKASACQLGADKSTCSILLFIDADTVVNDKAIERAISLLKANELDAISVVGYLRCKDFDKVITPFSFALLNALVPIKDVANTKKKTGYFFGSFILIRRDSYVKIGGHRAVRGYILEDKALGELAKASKLKIAIARGENLVSAEWAPGLSANIEALKRVLVPSMHGKKGWALASSVAISLLFLLPLLTVALGLLNAYFAFIGFGSLFFEFIFNAYGSKNIGVSVLYSTLFLLAEVILIIAFWRSLWISYRGGIVRWRGREYNYTAKQKIL